MKTKNHKGNFKITPGIEFNTSTIDQASKQLLKALEKATNCNTVTLDLTENSAFDSGTLKLVLATHLECRNFGLTLEIATTEEGVKFFRLFHLQSHMSIITKEPAE